MTEARFRTVNQSLGDAPRIGPFPADQVLPWTVILMGSYYVCKVIFGWTWVWTGVVAGWGCSTWWVLNGSKSWRFLSKFIGTPYWTRGYAFYQSLLEVAQIQPEPQTTKKRRKK